MINIYETHTMMAAISLMPPRRTFLRDRYFPTADEDIFVSEDVLIEYEDEEKKKLAPCVVPYKGGIPVAREGYKTVRYTPANVVPSRVLSITDLLKKQFGETLFSQQQPAQREAAYLKKDMRQLMSMIDGREEYMAAQTLLNNGYTMKHYADEYGGKKYEEYQIKFYDEATNPSVYIPSGKMDTSEEAGRKFLADIYAMACMITKRGLPATDVVTEPTLAAQIMNNEWIVKLMDNRKLDTVQLNPIELPDGVTYIGKINVLGKMLNFYCYEEEYVDELGGSKQFIPEGYAIVTAPNCGHTMYGAVTQIEEADHEYHTYASKRVPHITTDAKNSIKELDMNAKPLTAPRYKNCAVSAKFI